MSQPSTLPKIPDDLEFWLHGLPRTLHLIILHILRNECSTPDHLLLLADALQKISLVQTNPDTAMALQGCASGLRDLAPRYDYPRLEQEVYDALYCR